MRNPIIVDFKTVDPNGDLIFIAGTPQQVQAVGAIRPMAFVHSMEIDPRLPVSRRALLANALSHFGQGYIRNRPFVPCGCLFHIAPGNATMEAFARTLGGEPEPGSTYRIDYQP